MIKIILYSQTMLNYYYYRSIFFFRIWWKCN